MLRKKTVDNIYSTFDSPSNFKNIFNQSRKSSLIGLTATRKDMFLGNYVLMLSDQISKLTEFEVGARGTDEVKVQQRCQSRFTTASTIS